MDIKEGVIRDRDSIYSGLLHSQSLNHQLAVCYNSDGKLLVKISVVKNISRGKNGLEVTLVSPGEVQPETVIPLENIQSIYLISDFVK